MHKSIDQKQTGMKLKMMLGLAGYDVKSIQEYLNLSCPQSIYRWFKGKTLPSIEHLCALSSLLNVHMEALLVLEGQSLFHSVDKVVRKSYEGRLFSYTVRIYQGA